MVSHDKNWERGGSKMRELTKTCPKVHFFKLSWCCFRYEGVCLVRKGVKGMSLRVRDKLEKFPGKPREK